MNSRYRFSLLTKGIDKGPEKIEEEFHRQFIKSCYGFDVLTYATQITALNLALHSPETRLNHMSIQSIPLGYREDSTFASLGSLELIREPKLDVMTDRISRAGVETTGEESLKKIVSELGRPSLVVMNPPFTRPTGRGGRQGGGFFGFLSDENMRTRVRKEYNEVKDEVKRKLEVTGMALLDNPATKELKSLLGHKDFQAYKNIGLAGEGLLFLYLADKLVRRGGKICFVLPKSLLTGVSWFLARCLLASKYQIEYCVVSYDSKKGYNFSESTSLSECLIVARKREVQKEKETRFVILLEKPGTSVEAIGLSNTISEEPGDYVQSGNAKAFVLAVHRKAILEHIDNWGRFVFLPNLTLLREIEGLLGGTIKVGDVEGKMPVTRLNNLILSIGVDRHQFNSSFRIVDDHVPGSLAVLHGGGEEHRRRLEISLNTYALPKDDRGRRLFEEKAARLLLPDRFRFNTAHTVSMVSREQTLSNLFYAVRLKDECESKLKAICLYLNTTWGILTILASRQETEGAWIQLKMGHWRLISVLDTNILSKDRIRRLAEVFDEFKDRRLQRIPTQYGTVGRVNKARTELDLAFLRVMGISVKESDLLSLYGQIGSALKQWIGS